MHSANGNSVTNDGRRRWSGGGPVRRALVALLVAGVAVACGPAASDGPAVSPPPTLAPVVPTTASPSLAPSPSAPPSPATTAAPSASTGTGTDQKAPSAAPATRPATTPPASSKPAAADCEIVSNAGNCYNAGQFCRKADVGRSTHAANGRLIYCRQDGSQPRWGY